MNIGFEKVKCGSLIYLTVPQFTAVGGQKHCFTTRFGGVSTGHLSSLNMGLGRGDDPDCVKENFNRVFSAVDFCGENISITHQTHSTNVAVLDNPVFQSENTDALVTNAVGIPVMSYCADCVPILFYDPRCGVIATAHAGWKGTCNKIALKTVHTMQRTYGCNPSDILCAIGPSIGPCHFETDADVPDAFLKTFGETADKYIIRKGEKYFVDLWQFNIAALAECGICNDNITLARECTVCNHDMYFSNRAGRGRFGSMAAIIELKNHK